MASKHSLRHRFDSLEGLLAEALRTQLNHNRGKGSVVRLKGINEAIHESFANPANWDEKGVVVVTYVEPDGRFEPIGVFQELVHRRTQARKLMRVPTDVAPTAAVQTNRIEYFTDEYLFHPKVDPAPPAAVANPYERQAIRDYLARTKEQPLAEVLGSKVDAAKLLKQLKDMGVERI